MFAKGNKQNQLSLELILVLIVVALTCLLYKSVGNKMIILNLFYLPVVIGAFYLGRYQAGVLALLCIILASLVAAFNLADFATFTSPIVVGLAITIWAAVLGLMSLLVGTLSDEKNASLVELHEAHVGVIEVLARYLQNANPKLKDRSQRVAELSHNVATELRLSTKEVDEIRVAALLHDMESIEITSRVLRKAVGNLEEECHRDEPHTFHGTDLVQSLSQVLTGAIPLLLNQNDVIEPGKFGEENIDWSDIPFGARIIQTVRDYDTLVGGKSTDDDNNPTEAIEVLRNDTIANHHPNVLNALESCVVSSRQPQRTSASEKVALSEMAV